ncbi:MAG: LlaJI family restriction endonuclease [Clostridium sp.]|uniref:LlaJI family restriction endonuclease n=1 Tax=Clostridium sp. TaxID=1506 RepID=UPI003EE61BFF
MKTIYIRELKKYTFNNIVNKFEVKDEKQGIYLLEKLKAYGIIKSLKKKCDDKELDDLITDEVEVLDENIEKNDKKYIFKYVGIVTISKYIIICFPKYIKEDRPELQMKQILKVIKKYNEKEQIIKFYNEGMEEKRYNQLSIIISLISDYYEFGLYQKEEEFIDINSDGEILWDKTINESYAYIFNNRPHYLELYTSQSRYNEEDYFTRLHQVILTECSRKLEYLKLRELLDIERIQLSELSIEDFGDEEYILYKLEREMKGQYITKKQNILKAIYAYIAHSQISTDGIGVCFYGTNSFNLVWENVCSEVLENKINVKLKKLPLNGIEKYKNNTLKEIIEKPIWKIYEDGKERIAKETLIPDLISIFKMDSVYMFAIFDAKYYDLKYNDLKIWNQPGVADINKQYLYQLAYEEFINKSGYIFITNAFLIPTEKKTNYVGQAKMNIFLNIRNINLKNIEIIELNVKEVYEAYIENKSIDIQELMKFINEKNYKDEVENNIGIKIIINALEKIKEKEIEYEHLKLDTESFCIKEKEDELYQEKKLLTKMAIELDRYFKQKENLEIEDIKNQIKNKILKQENINEKIVRKLKSIYDEIYLPIYWRK